MLKQNILQPTLHVKAIAIAISNYPKAKDPDLIGEYPALVKACGDYVWDDVLEYRVWYHPHDERLTQNTSYSRPAFYFSFKLVIFML